MKVKGWIFGWMLILLIAVATAPSLLAQSLVSGDLTGAVTDPSGAVVPNAKVSLKSAATGETRTTVTSAVGAYRFSLLPPGSYTVTVSADGFNNTSDMVTVNVGQATIADVKMMVGANTQTIEVNSASPLVQADNADLSTNF